MVFISMGGPETLEINPTLRPSASIIIHNRHQQIQMHLVSSTFRHRVVSCYMMQVAGNAVFGLLETNSDKDDGLFLETLSSCRYIVLSSLLCIG